MILQDLKEIVEQDASIALSTAKKNIDIKRYLTVYDYSVKAEYKEYINELFNNIETTALETDEIEDPLNEITTENIQDYVYIWDDEESNKSVRPQNYVNSILALDKIAQSNGCSDIFDSYKLADFMLLIINSYDKKSIDESLTFQEAKRIIKTDISQYIRALLSGSTRGINTTSLTLAMEYRAYTLVLFARIGQKNDGLMISDLTDISLKEELIKVFSIVSNCGSREFLNEVRNQTTTVTLKDFVYEVLHRQLYPNTQISQLNDEPSTTHHFE
jgi:hypothetical protein